MINLCNYHDKIKNAPAESLFPYGALMLSLGHRCQRLYITTIYEKDKEKKV